MRPHHARKRAAAPQVSKEPRLARGFFLSAYHRLPWIIRSVDSPKAGGRLREMKIRVEFESSVAGSTSYMEVLVPPFPPHEDTRVPILRIWEEQWGHREDSIESQHQIKEFALTKEQASSLVDAVRAVQIRPSIGSFRMFRTVDGWSTTLTLDACDPKVLLRWFLHAPPEWIGVSELCDEIQRIANERTR
jgi:hypothetical protein